MPLPGCRRTLVGRTCLLILGIHEQRVDKAISGNTTRGPFIRSRRVCGPRCPRKATGGCSPRAPRGGARPPSTHAPTQSKCSTSWRHTLRRQSPSLEDVFGAAPCNCTRSMVVPGAAYDEPLLLAPALSAAVARRRGCSPMRACPETRGALARALGRASAARWQHR